MIASAPDGQIVKLFNATILRTLQHLLGHAALQMRQGYLQSLSDDNAVMAHRRFSPLDNMKV